MSSESPAHRWSRRPKPALPRRALPVGVFVVTGALALWLAVSPPQHWLVDAAVLLMAGMLAGLVAALQWSGGRAEELVIRRTAELEASRAAADAIAERLRRSEQRFRNLFESNGDAIIVSGTDRRIEMVNPAMLRTFGYAGDGPLLGQLSSIVYSDTGMFEAAGRQIRANTDGTPIIIDARFRRANGEEFPAEMRLCYVHDDAGEIAGYIGVIRDATERRRAEAALRHSEMFANAVFDNAPIAIHVLDAEGYSLRMNEAFKELMGLPDTNFGIGRFNVLTNGFFNRIGLSDRYREAYAGEVVEIPDTEFEVDRGDAGDVQRTRIAYDLTLFPIPGPAGRGVQAVVSFVRDISERKEAERARQESQANFTALIENTDDYMWSVRPGYVLLSANSAFTGAVRGRIGREIQPGDCVIDEAFTPEEQAEWRAYYDRAFAGERFGIERASTSPGDGERASDVRFNPIRDAAGQVIGTTVVSHDITEAKQAERALRENEERYRKTIENLHDVFYQTNVDDEFTYLSPSALKLHGYRPEELIGTKTRDLYVDPKDQDALVAELQAGRKVNDYEVEMRCKDGGTVWVSVNAKIIGGNGVATGIQGTTRDIGGRRKAEQAIRESEERYRKTFEGLHDMFYQTDAQGLITMMSPSCLRHTGYTPAELVGQPVGSLFADSDRFTEIVRALAYTDTLNDREATLRRSDGGIAPVSVNATALRDADGAVIGYEGTLRDIAERKRAEEELDRVFNLTVDLLAVVAPGGALQRINPAWEATLGYTESELLGQIVWGLVHPDDVANSRRGARAIDRGEVVKDLRGRFRCKDGSWKWLGWSMTRAEGTEDIYCVARDVSELMHAEEQTRRAQEDLEETLEAMRASQAVLEEQAEAMDKMRIEAEHIANHDMLTGVVNRRAWFAEATAQKPTAIAIFDIDYFKRVNDSYGHPAGDSVLIEVSRRLQSALPEGALLGRLGGEEFGALFLGSFSEARAASAAAVRAIADVPFVLPDGSSIAVSVSGGLAPWRPEGQSRERSLANTYEDADAALYEAKAAGRRTLAVRGTRRAA